MLGRLALPALLALALASWHWSPTHVPAPQGAAVTVTADDDAGMWTWLAAPGVAQTLPATLALLVLLVAAVVGLRQSQRNFGPRPRAPPSG